MICFDQSCHGQCSEQYNRPSLLVTLSCDFQLRFLQILNLTQALKDDKSPVQLVQMPVVVVERSRRTYGKGRQRTQSETFTQKFMKRAPFFSWC